MGKIHGSLEVVVQVFFQLLRDLSSRISFQFVYFLFCLKLVSDYVFRVLKVLVENCFCQSFSDLGGVEEFGICGLSRIGQSNAS